MKSRKASAEVERKMRVLLVTPSFGGGRTGAALKTLGLCPYTFPGLLAKHILVHPSRFTKVLSTTPHGLMELDTTFGGYDAVAGLPGSALWPQLAAHYPDAVVILDASFEDVS